MKNVDLPAPPGGWGEDEITTFIDKARRNSFATYANFRPEFGKVAEIDVLFRKLVDNLLNTKDWFAAFFLLRAHSAFLAGAHLATSGQAVETYASLRLSLEHGLYGVYLSRNPGSRETWLRRHDNEQAKQRVRGEFRIRKLFATLRELDNKEATVADQLYKRRIDYGAHPNERALTVSLKRETGPEAIEFRVVYLTDDPVIFRGCLKTVAQVGASVLGMFRLVFRERYELSGLTDELNRARVGL
jgi:hypothetical protein